MVAYKQDDVLKALAEELIEAHHPHLQHAKISYQFRNEATYTRGKVICGKAIRVDDRNYAIHNVDFIIEIAKDIWDEAEPPFRKAILDHELCHLGVALDDEEKPTYNAASDRLNTFINIHDVEDFEAIVTRHGEYRSDIRNFIKAFEKRKEDARKKPKAEKEDATDAESLTEQALAD